MKLQNSIYRTVTAEEANEFLPEYTPLFHRPQLPLLARHSDTQTFKYEQQQI